MNIEEIKELREKVEELRRDMARLHGRLDEVEFLLLRSRSEKTEVSLCGLKGMAQAYDSLIEPGCPLPQIYMHLEDLELYELWQTEHTPYAHIIGHFKGSRIQELESCRKGLVMFKGNGRTIFVGLLLTEGGMLQ